MRDVSKFRLVFTDVDGCARDEPLEQCWSARFEEVQPVRAFGSFRGQRHFSGLWWSATTARHVGYESWLERDRLMMLDFDQTVVGVSSQPFWLRWPGGRHVPDYFARLACGTGVVVDVRADDRIRPEDAEKFATMATACGHVGWHYRRVGTPEPMLAANLRWLAGYRHPRCRDAPTALRLQAVLHRPMPLEQAVELAGDRLRVLPTLFHLMWAQDVHADLTSSLLAGTTNLAWNESEVADVGVAAG